MSSVALRSEDVPKPKKFVGTMSACDVDNFLWKMENYFCAKGIMDDAVKIGTCQEFQCELKGQFYPKLTEEEARGKVARDNATGHSGGVCSRVQGTHAPSFRCDRERSIVFFSEWIEAVGQIECVTKRCPKAVENQDGSRVCGLAWSRERQDWVFQVRGKGRM
ncbi:hypothetical protein Gotri_025776 [Gossypium trilobum]|uniref:Uncharacterized protein n=1 Tax=Gossypium trilobum TaxID=34281 RepID=A0A7J9FMZ7_9ROSI|nr:hypothetical protein [Gossypium trilobum]